VPTALEAFVYFPERGKRRLLAVARFCGLKLDSLFYLFVCE
jgi:hypothetical protein